MTSLGSHVFFESFNEKGKKIKLEKYGFSWFWNDLNQVLPFCRTFPTITKSVYNVPFNNCHYFELCKSIPDRHPIAKKDDLSDGPKICTVYKHIFEIK